MYHIIILWREYISLDTIGYNGRMYYIIILYFIKCWTVFFLNPRPDRSSDHENSSGDIRLSGTRSLGAIPYDTERAAAVSDRR